MCFDTMLFQCWEDREGRKAMSKNNAKGLTTLRQRVRRYNRDNFEDEVTKYRDNPDAEGDTDEECKYRKTIHSFTA